MIIVSRGGGRRPARLTLGPRLSAAASDESRARTRPTMYIVRALARESGGAQMSFGDVAPRGS